MKEKQETVDVFEIIERTVREPRARRCACAAARATYALRTLAHRFGESSVKRQALDSVRLALAISEVQDMGLTVGLSVNFEGSEP